MNAASVPTPWEYATRERLTQIELNSLGREGWELVAVDGGKCYLKRPLLSFRERVTLEQRTHVYESAGQTSNVVGELHS